MWAVHMLQREREGGTALAQLARSARYSLATRKTTATAPRPLSHPAPLIQNTTRVQGRSLLHEVRVLCSDPRLCDFGQVLSLLKPQL